MALPTETITFIKNGKLTGPLDCNGQLLNNADPDSFPTGGGGSGNDTGTTTAILKGDGNHGFDDAVADIDYTTPSGLSSGLATKEPTLPTTTNDHYLLARRNVASGSAYEYVNPTGVGINTGISVAIQKGNAAGGLTDALAGTDYPTVAAVNAKEPTLPTTTNDHYLLARRNVAAGSAYEYVNPTSVGANTGVTTAILKGNSTGGFADALAGTDYPTVASVAAKEPLLPTTTNDSYILARHNAGGANAWFFVDPVTLGSTNATFTDGVTHSSTTFDSVLAGFNSNDVGKVIASAGNITPGTTITGVSAGHCTLSAVALTSTSPVTFTIVNRFLVASGGTVTSVAVTNNASPVGVDDLVQTNVTTPTASATIVLTKPNAPGKSFYGNASAGATAPAFMNQTSAFAALDMGTAGRSIAQIPNPNVDAFIKIVGTTNLAQTRTPAQTLGDIGGEGALTFNTPLARGAAPNTQTISIPAAASNPTQVNGYLSGADHAAFTAKLASDRKLTTTTPITITGPSGPVSGTPVDLSADRTIAMPAASSTVGPPIVQVSGYLTGADHATFTAKVPGTRTLTTTAPLLINGPSGDVSGVAVDLTANRTIKMPAATALVDGYLSHTDFANFNTGSVKTINAPASGTMTQIAITSPLTTRVQFVQLLTGNLVIPLPALAPYTNSFIEFVDLTGGAFAASTFTCSLKPVATESIDGGVLGANFVLPRGLGYLRLNAGGGTSWFTTKYFVDSFRDPSDPTKQVRVNLGTSFPINTIRTFSPASAGDSVSVVVPVNSFPDEAVRGISNDGTLLHSPITGDQVIPGQVTVLGTADSIVSTTGAGKQVTVIQLITALTANRSYTVPDSTPYDPGQEIVFFDSTGNPNGFIATLVAPALNTINGGGTFPVNDGIGRYFRRVLCADPATKNWTIGGVSGTAASGLTLDIWHPVSPLSGVATLTCSGDVVENHHIVNMSAPVTLLMGGTIPPGATGKIKFRDSTGGHVVTVPNFTGRTPTAGGVGVFTTSTGAAIEDEYGWDFDGTKVNYYPIGLKMANAATATFTTIADDTTAAAGSVTSTNQADAIAKIYVATKLTAGGGVGVNPGDPYAIGKVRLSLLRVGTPNYNLRVEIRADSAGSVSTTLVGAASDPVAASSLGVSEGNFDFNTSANLISGTVYWLLLYGDSSGTSASFNDGHTDTATNVVGPPASSIFTSASAAFVSTDVGKIITGTNIPSNTAITSVTNGTTIVINKQVTNTGSNLPFTIANRYYVNWTAHSTAGNTLYTSQLGQASWQQVSIGRLQKYITFKSP